MNSDWGSKAAKPAAKRKSDIAAVAFDGTKPKLKKKRGPGNAKEKSAEEKRAKEEKRLERNRLSAANVARRRRRKQG